MTVRMPSNTYDGGKVRACDRLGAVPRDVQPFDVNRPRARRKNAKNHVDGRGLPCSIGTQKADDPLPVHLERDAVYRR